MRSASTGASQPASSAWFPLSTEKLPVVNRLITGIARRDILTPKDAKDMSFIISKLDNARMSIHNLMFRTALFTMYSKPSTYEALCKRAGAPQPDSCPPDSKSMEQALVKLYAAREPVWGGMFYMSTGCRGGILCRPAHSQS